MSEYKLIKSCGLEIIGAGMSNYAAVKACDLEAFLEKGVVVYGSPDKRYWDDHPVNELHQAPVSLDFYDQFPKTHSALIINITLIAKPLEPVSKNEIINNLKWFKENANPGKSYLDGLIKRIEASGVKND